MDSIPMHVTSRWIATLGDEQLQAAEAELHAEFREREGVEKLRRGARYELLRGPSALVDAWHRWSMVSNEARLRGIAVRHQR